MAHGLPSAAREKRLTMVCYARPAIRMGAVVLVVLLILGRAGAHVLPGHFLGTAALMAGVTVAAGGAAVAATVAFVAFRSIRRKRAVAGGCVHCQFRCQHAMVEPGQRPLARVAQPGAVPPRWPDRPAYRSGAAARTAGARERRERARTPA
jgi:hypothetical protein